MVDKFLEVVKGGAASQRHLTTCLHRLVLPLLTTALAGSEDVVSKSSMDFIMKDMLGTSKTAKGLTGGALRLLPLLLCRGRPEGAWSALRSRAGS